VEYEKSDGESIKTMDSLSYIILHLIINAYNSAQSFDQKRNSKRQAGRNT